MPSRPLGSRATADWLEANGFGLLFGLAVVLNLLPIWTVAWLPMQDLGGHMELMDVMARYGDAGTLYSEVFALPESLGPNTLSLYAGWLLGPLLGTAVVTKLLLSFYVVAMPLSVLSLCRAFDRSPWLAFLTVPLVFNAILNVGFLNYLLALPLLLWAIPLGKRLSTEGGWRVWTLLALDLLALLLAHVIGWLIGAALAVFFAVLYLRRASDLVRLTALLPSAPVFAVWFHRMFVALEPTEAGRTFGTGDGVGAVFSSLDARIVDFHTWGAQLFRDSTEETVLVLIGLVWLCALALAQSGPRQEAPPRDPVGFLRHHALELMTLITVIAYFSLPSHAHEVAILTERIVLLILIFLLLWPRLPVRGPRAWIMAPAVVACVLYPFVVQAKFARFEAQRVGDLPAAIAELPDRSRLAYRLAERDDATVYHGPLWHIPKAIHALDNGGISHDSFAIRPYTPIQYKPGQTPAPMQRFMEGSGDIFAYDHFLLYSAAEPKRTLQLSHLTLRWKQGGWYLFDVEEDPAAAELEVIGAGGRGGHLSRWDCPDGQALVAVSGAHRRWIHHMRARCGRLAPPGKTGVLVASGASSRRFGKHTDGLQAKAVRCADDHVAIGLYGETGAFIISVGLLCAKLEDVRAGESPLPVSRAGRIGAGRTGDDTFEIRCPEGTVARGWRGREGLVIDRVGLACGAPVAKALTPQGRGPGAGASAAPKPKPKPKPQSKPKPRVRPAPTPTTKVSPTAKTEAPAPPKADAGDNPGAGGGGARPRTFDKRVPAGMAGGRDRLNRSPRRRVSEDEE